MHRQRGEAKVDILYIYGPWKFWKILRVHGLLMSNDINFDQFYEFNLWTIKRNCNDVLFVFF